MLNTFAPDECCGKRISKALLDGQLDTADYWQCPKCGMEWRPEIIALAPARLVTASDEHTLRHWTPRPAVALARVR